MLLLNDLYVDVEKLNDEESDLLGKKLFCEQFLNQGKRGVFILHDGSEVFFFEDRYEHAFHTSCDRIRKPYSKLKIARDRISRVKWIKPIIQGKIAGTECWEVYSHQNKQRLYIIYAKKYLIWLESRKDGKWKFSTAYTVNASDIRRYTARGRKIWEVNNNAP